MRVKTPEISWHDTTPVYSCDFQPVIERSSAQEWSRLATCGRDNVIRLWRVPLGSGEPEYLSSLRRHDKPVNIVRFCPTGADLLASGADDGAVILWKRDANASASAAASARSLFGQDEDEETSREIWQVKRVLRKHLEDVYDLCWSSTGDCLVSGSVDQSVIEWNLKSGQQLLLKDHKAYVQGVAWDPRDEYVLSLSSDRSCRVYRVGSRNCSYNIARHDKQRLFQDDSWKSFFRRLSYSPDGALLVCPSACVGGESHGAYVFTRQSLPSPVVALPSDSRPAVAVRFCPTPFALPEGVTPLFGLPYVWVFCLVLEDGLLFFNTVSKHPIAYVGGIHYQALNDCSWSSDGRTLVTCSTDGYCSVVRFDPGELGRPCDEKVNIAAAFARELGAAELAKKEAADGSGPRKTEEPEPRKEPLKSAIRASPAADKPSKGLRVTFSEQGEPVERKEPCESSVMKDPKPNATRKKESDEGSVMKEAKPIATRKKESDESSVMKEAKPIATRKESDKSSVIKEAKPIATRKKEPDEGSVIKEAKPIAARKKESDEGSVIKEAKPIATRKKESDESSVTKDAKPIDTKKDESSVTKKAKPIATKKKESDLNSETKDAKPIATKKKKKDESSVTKEAKPIATRKKGGKSAVNVIKTSSVMEEAKETLSKETNVSKSSGIQEGAVVTEISATKDISGVTEISATKDTSGVTEISATKDISGVKESPATQPPGKKRRVTFVTLGDEAERSKAVPVVADASGDSSGDAPRKRRVTITTLSGQPSGGGSPLQPMKRRVPLTTLSHSVSPDEVTDNLSNMSAPEFQLHLEDSNQPRMSEDVSLQPPE